jgi:hypothetical protein
MSEHISDLVNRVDSSAWWRSNKAAQYPDDKRNVTSSESLTKLGKHLAALPPDDEHVVAYEELMEEAVGLEESGDLLVEISTFETRFIGRYGFDYPQDGDPAEFLAELTGECRELVNAAKELIDQADAEERYEAAKETADEAAKEAAHEAAHEAAEEAAKEAAEEAYRETYEETYREVYEEAYREALTEALEETS